MSETTRYTWEHIYEIPVVEFFSYLSYIKEKRRREAEAIKKIKNKHS